jgi:glycosyltransferase involved in cell wall biosynthesis
MRVCLSAYACEPDRGSEPGVGWEWAMRLANRLEVTVITRANNREVIEALIGNDLQSTKPRFIFLDLPNFCIRLKKKGILPVSLYYLLWQLKARVAVRNQLKSFDLVHHVTFNGFRFPGAWWFTETPVVLGPLGGGSITDAAYRSCFGSRWIIEWIRGWSIRLWKLNPWTIVSLLSSDAVITVGKDLANRFASLGIEADRMLETAVPFALEHEPPSLRGSERKDFLLVGNLEPWKGWQIAFEAYARAVSLGLKDHNLIVIGSGRQQAQAVKRASALGLNKQIEFRGQLTREQVWDRMRSSRGLIFTSIRDTSGNAALEAMALSTPVVCFNHQGVGWMTDDSCAIRIEPSSWNNSVMGFADAFIQLAGSDFLVDKMGKAGRQRAITNFSWLSKIEQALNIYNRVINKHKNYCRSE